MPKQKDLKRRVRERMRKTGESYTAARANVVASKAPPLPSPTAEADLAATAGMSDAAVSAKTGRTWKAWVRALDGIDATRLAHRDIARHLQDVEGLGGWWAQTVTVGYERIRGLRKKGQRRGGAFEVNKSKTLPVPVEELYAAFGARRRRQWLGDAAWRVRSATPPRSQRVVWEEDGTPVDLHFWSKGPGKSQVQLQHRGLPDEAAAARVREAWTRRLAALADFLT